MSYDSEKHEPKTMKAKADLMLKRGSISEKQHKKLHAKADVEIDKAKKPKPDNEAAEGKVTPQVSGDADATETPKKRKGAIKDDVMRGQADDEEEKEL